MSRRQPHHATLRSWPVRLGQFGLTLLVLLSGRVLADFSITSATLDGGAVSRVAPSATVSVALTLDYSGIVSGANGRWYATLWTVNGVSTCADHANRSEPGPDSVTFNITAPASAGQYNVSFQAFSSNNCSGQNSATYTLSNGLVVGAQPIVEYRFDTSTPTDSSANALNGTLNGGVTTGAAGKVCNAYRFNGSDGYVSVPHNNLLNLSQVSVGAWVRHATATYKPWEAILAKGDTAYRLHLNGGCSINSPSVDEALTLGINYGCAGADINSNLIPASNQWYHVLGTYDGSDIKIYVDGVLQASAAYAGAIYSNSFPLNIGDNAQQPGRNWDGDIDEVKVFASALSAAQIAAGYANESAGLNWDGSTRSCPNSTASCSHSIYSGGGLSIGNDSEINNHNISGTGNTLDANGTRTSTSQTLGALSPASFPSYSGSTDYSGSASSLGSRCSLASPCDQVTFTSGTLPSGTYYINSLTISGSVTFGGGTVYAQTMTVNEDRNVSFTAVTDFRIAGSVSIGKDADLRCTGAGVGSVPARFYLYNGADFTAGKDGRFEGIVVGPDSGSNIIFGEEWDLTGGFMAGGSISLGKESNITFNSAVEAALTSSGACGGGTPPPTPAANFNCVESGASASSGHLYTKLAGTAFSFDVVALKADGSQESDYAEQGSESVSVVLVDGAGNTVCASRAGLSPAMAQTLTFTSADNGRKSVSFTVDKAYANLRCRVTDGEVTGCSTDNFAVRPHGLTVSSTANADASGSSASATPTVKAGANFSLSATAIAGYTGTPTFDPSKLQAHTGGTAGTLAGSFNAAAANDGVATGTTFTYSEVGYFRYASQGVIDATFTAVDSAGGDCTDDFSNSLSSGKYGCKFGNETATDYFGRFTPDHFTITAGALTHGCNAGAFTYYGQPFETAFQLTAQNVANVATVNYEGSFARFPSLAWTDQTNSPTGLRFSAVDGAGAAVTLQDGGVFTGVNWTDGVANMTSASHKVQRALSGKPTSPASITVKALPVDADGVTLTPATAVAVHSGTAPQRFGRLFMDNAMGSERLDLAVPTRAQYWDGKGFVTNGQDSCTSLLLPSLIAPASADNSLLASDSTPSYGHAPLAAGDAGLILSAPLKSGYLDLRIDLTDLPWLQYDWDGTDQLLDGNLFDDDPRVRATFGKRGNAPGIIYRREVY